MAAIDSKVTFNVEAVVTFTRHLAAIDGEVTSNVEAVFTATRHLAAIDGEGATIDVYATGNAAGYH